MSPPPELPRWSRGSRRPKLAMPSTAPQTMRSRMLVVFASPSCPPCSPNRQSRAPALGPVLAQCPNAENVARGVAKVKTLAAREIVPLDNLAAGSYDGPLGRFKVIGVEDD